MTRATGYLGNSRTSDGESARVARSHGSPWVHPYDYVLVGTMITAFALWALTGVPLLPLRPWIWEHLEYLVPFFVSGFLVLFVARLAIAVWRRRSLSGKRALAIVRRHFGKSAAIVTGRYLAAFCVVMTVQSSIKQAFPFINHHRYDDALRTIERYVHFGFDPAWELAALPTPEWWAFVLDSSYYLWFPIIPVIAAYFITHRNRRKRDHYLTSVLAVWIVGVLIGLAFPSHGPRYVDPARFPGPDMPIAAATQAWLAERYAALETITIPGDGGMTFGCGLMAMPSLHVTLCVLYAIFFWGESRWMRWTAIAYAIIVFLGSMYSGWHYAVDGYAGLALAFGATWAGGKLSGGRAARQRVVV